MRTTSPKPQLETLFPGNSEMARRTRAFDWSATPLGPAEYWPHSLRTAIRIVLDSRYPMLILWGEELIGLYNDAYARTTLGGKHPSAFGQAARKIFSESWADIGPRIESVLRTGQSAWDEELMLILERSAYPEETYHTFSYSPVPGDNGDIGGIICSVSDETQRVVGERRTKTLRELAALATEDATSVEQTCQAAARILAGNRHDLPFVLIYLLDSESKGAHLAGAAGMAYGSAAAPASISLLYPQNPDQGWPLHAVMKSGRTEVVSELGQRFGVLSDGIWPDAPHSAVVLPIRKSGQDRIAGFLVAGVSPRSPLDDHYHGFFGLLANQIASMTASARAYEEERRRADTLAERDRAKTAFFSDISHEFRTPLTLLLGPIEDLLAMPYGSFSRDVHEQLGTIRRNALRLQRLVNTLMDFSYFEAGRIQASYEPTDLATFTTDLASVFRAVVESAGLRLIVDCPPLPEPVFVDRDMWEKIVLNILSNAFRYTLEGEIRVELRAENGAAILSVRDTGIGIPEAELPNLFKRFQRIHGARGRSDEGTGVGLAFVLDLVKLHGGTVQADSRIGKGSTFAVRIPFGHGHLPAERDSSMRTLASTVPGAHSFVQEARQWQRDTGPRQLGATTMLSSPDLTYAPDGKPKARVLVVDDNTDMREYLQRLLKSEYEVISAADGAQALRAALQYTPDLVLSDVMMPGLDGIELLRMLRAETATAATSVILLSARADEQARIEGMKAGADDYLTKPVSARELLARVSATVALAKLRRKALRREEELQARTVSILESMNEAFISVDAQWRITYVNAAGERLSELCRDRLLDMNYWEVFPATQGTIVEQQLLRAMVNRVSVRFEHYYPPYGRWFEVAASPGASGGLLLYGHDITDRKRAQEALQATEACLTVELEAMSQLHELSTRLLTAPDLKSALEEVLDAAIAMLGAAMGTIQLYNPQTKALEIVTQRGFGQDFLAHFHMLRSDLSSACGRAAKHERRVVIEDVQADRAYEPHREIAASAGYRAVQSTPLMSRNGQLLGILSTHFRRPHRPSERDLRMLDLYSRQAIALLERIRAEDALRENETKSRALAEASPALIWQLDPHGSAVYLNPQYRKLLGRVPNDLMGVGWHGLVHPDDAPGYMNAVVQAQRQRTRLHHRVRFESKDGDWRWLDSNALPWFTADGEYAGHVGISIDITEAVRAEEARKESEHRRKDEFLATLAHELRNPLAPICDALHILEYSGDARATNRLHEIMERQVNHMVRLVDDLLEVSRITRGKIELCKAPVELGAIVHAAAEVSKPLIASGGHELTIDLPAEPLMLDADAVRLTQVFFNLLDNAAKYTAKGGCIEVAAQRSAAHVIVSVRDNGIGIASDILPQVFDMFAQSDHSTARNHGGLGIGLTLVRGIVEMHGGEVEARSAGPRLGSEFVVRLPLAENFQPASSAPALPPSNAGLSRQRILVVDDNRDAAESLAMLLKVLGAEVDVVHDGPAALAALEDRRPAVVLMDIGMPGMDGYQVAQLIRQDPRFHDITLIALTGWGQEEDRRRAHASGFDHHLLKPVDIQALQTLLMTA